MFGIAIALATLIILTAVSIIDIRERRILIESPILRLSHC